MVHCLHIGFIKLLIMKAIEFIFKKYSAENKRKFINEMTTPELLGTSYQVIERCVKEAGKRIDPKHTAKRLYLDREIARNHWNSTIENIYEGKLSKKDKKNCLILECYIQGDDTDGTDWCKLSHFLDNRYEEIVVATLDEEFRNGYKHTVSAAYDRNDRADVIKAILLSYIDSKYGK